jgi:diguanylate cyclase (GGDEF)-like protein/PAS domain S-box-containing protein
MRTDEAAWLAKTPSRTLEMIVMPDGSKRYFDIIKSPLYNKDGTHNILIVFGHDVTDLSRLMERQKLAEQVLANSREAVMITDPQNNIISVNRAFTTVTGFTEAEVIGKNPRILASGRQDRDFYREMWHQINTEGVWRGDIWDKKKSGEIYLKWLDISSAHDLTGQLSNYIAIFSDLTERRALDERIEYLAYHDQLTGLPNRVLLHDRFKQAVASATRKNTMIAVLFLDLDKFKQVNDALGHAAGDELLQLVARRIEQSVREVDTVSRIGGDEFAILLTNLPDAQTISAIAEKILTEMTAHFTISGNTVDSSLSIGISLYPTDGLELDLLLRMADASMYHAKNCGRNNYRFFSDQSAHHELVLKTKF